jgi:hypothetical protein
MIFMPTIDPVLRMAPALLPSAFATRSCIPSVETTFDPSGLMSADALQ